MRNYYQEHNHEVNAGTVLVTGSESGLGNSILNKLYTDGWTTFGPAKNQMNVQRFLEILAWKDALKIKQVDAIVNCAGVNIIDYLTNFDISNWDEVMDTNARSIFFMAKAFAEELRGGTMINIVSNAAHVPMTCSAAYNASKGAALILTKQLARELKATHDITVFSVSPNKLRGTGMSKDIEEQVCKVRGWTPEFAREYQKKALLAGEETDPETLAEFIAFLLSTKERHKYLAGCDIQYGL